MNLTVSVDGKESDLQTEGALTDILAALGVETASAAVVLNGRPVRQQVMKTTVLKEADRLEIRTKPTVPQRTRDIFPIRPTTSAEEVLYTIRKWAGEVGYQVTPDQRQLNALVKGLVKNSTKYGEPLCPCMPKEITGDPVRDAPIACPCVYVDADIQVQGACKCKLFVSNEYHAEMERSLNAMNEL